MYSARPAGFHPWHRLWRALAARGLARLESLPPSGLNTVVTRTLPGKILVPSDPARRLPLPCSGRGTFSGSFQRCTLPPPACFGRKRGSLCSRKGAAISLGRLTLLRVLRFSPWLPYFAFVIRPLPGKPARHLVDCPPSVFPHREQPLSITTLLEAGIVGV